MKLKDLLNEEITPLSKSLAQKKDTSSQAIEALLKKELVTTKKEAMTGPIDIRNIAKNIMVGKSVFADKKYSKDLDKNILQTYDRESLEKLVNDIKSKLSSPELQTKETLQNLLASKAKQAFANKTKKIGANIASSMKTNIT